MINKVELIDWYGGDKAIARAAWTSTSTDVELKTDEQIRDLLVNKLWNNGSGKPHKSPFERGIVEFNITCDTASHIHIIKHRLANVNGQSARYREIKEDNYLLPEDWGNIKISQTDLGSPSDTWIERLKEYSEEGNRLYHECTKDLTPVLGRKRAKESARFFKTYNSQLTLSVMMNMSWFYNFYTLRSDSAAQLEIQEIAIKMLKVIEDIEGNPFKYTLEAFNIKSTKYE